MTEPDYTKSTHTLDGRRVVVWDDPENPFVKGTFVTGDTSTEYSWYREDGRLVNCPEFYTRSDLAAPSDEPEPKAKPTPQPRFDPTTARPGDVYKSPRHVPGCTVYVYVNKRNCLAIIEGGIIIRPYASLPPAWYVLSHNIHEALVRLATDQTDAPRTHLSERQTPVLPSDNPETPTTNQA